MSVVVVIDDDPDTLEVVTHILAGNDVRTFTDPIEAMTPAVWEGATAGVLDLMMARASGVIVLRWMAIHVPHVRRIVLTAMGLRPEESMELADVWLEKPQGLSRLHEAVGG